MQYAWPDFATCKPAMANFGKMSAEDDKKDQGDVKCITRWHCIQDFTGGAICEGTYEAISIWGLNWAPAGIKLKIKPVCGDDLARKVRSFVKSSMWQQGKEFL